MMFACDTNNKYRDKIICAVHQSDFTARPQIVDNDNDEIFDLLEKFSKLQEYQLKHHIICMAFP